MLIGINVQMKFQCDHCGGKFKIFASVPVKQFLEDGWYAVEDIVQEKHQEHNSKHWRTMVVNGKPRDVCEFCLKEYYGINVYGEIKAKIKEKRHAETADMFIWRP